MSDDLATEFWKRAGKVTAGMLSASGAPPRPMAHQTRDGDQALWFITANGTDIADAAAEGARAQHIIACGHGHLYAAIDGTLSVEHSKPVLDDIWSPLAAAWFDEGREDRDVCLVRFTPSQAEVWTTDGAAKTLFEMTRASVANERPDVGAHGHLRF
ncbi:pyridoxamine 5'-phosphate oxidase family protein [Roseovarius spongiae]|nr:pyridoxamine 5'-phosphate oxidase family protein [Roseovarius spongiae]